MKRNKYSILITKKNLLANEIKPVGFGSGLNQNKYLLQKSAESNAINTT